MVVTSAESDLISVASSKLRKFCIGRGKEEDMQIQDECGLCLLLLSVNGQNSVQGCGYLELRYFMGFGYKRENSSQ